MIPSNRFKVNHDRSGMHHVRREVLNEFGRDGEMHRGQKM